MNVYQEEFGWLKNSISSGVDFLPNTMFRWGYRWNFLIANVW